MIGQRAVRRGVTLVEVLVAVTICGAGLALIASAASGAVRAEAYAASVSRAVDHADLVLGRLESGELLLEDASGDFSEDGAPELTWSIKIDTTDTANLSVAEVTVTWTLHNVQRDLVLERMVFVDPEEGTR